MMRNKTTILMIDIRSEHYDENNNQRLILKEVKVFIFLYGKYQNMSYTEEVFENLKD